MRHSFSKRPFKLKVSLESKLFITILFSLSLITAFFSYSMYTEINQTLLNGLRNELISTARTAAVSIDADKHGALEASRNEHSRLYRELKQQLIAIKKANPKISNVYTMTKTDDPNIWQFIVDAETDATLISHLGDRYDVSKFAEMQRAFEAPTADKGFTVDKWGTWLSGYSPLYDSKGRAAAIVGIDMSADTVIQKIEEEKRLLTLNLLLLLILPALISLIVARSASRALTKTIRIAKRSSEQMDEQGLYLKASCRATGLRASLNGMLTNLCLKVGDILASTEFVASAAHQIADRNQELSRRTQEQAAALSETAATIEEITATVKENAEHAVSANATVRHAVDMAQRRKQVIGDTVDSMNDIAQASRKIAEITDVVNEIAFQTNLLALNASVEAARAGEQGKGFAVVAGEVRNLAQRSAKAAKEIRDLIQDSLDKTRKGNDLINDYGETLEELILSMQTVADTVAEIAAASQEQAAGIDQVNKMVAMMDGVVQQDELLVQDLAAASRGLGLRAKETQELMADFGV